MIGPRSACDSSPGAAATFSHEHSYPSTSFLPTMPANPSAMYTQRGIGLGDYCYADLFEGDLSDSDDDSHDATGPLPSQSVEKDTSKSTDEDGESDHSEYIAGDAEIYYKKKRQKHLKGGTAPQNPQLDLVYQDVDPPTNLGPFDFLAPLLKASSNHVWKRPPLSLPQTATHCASIPDLP